ncbi:retron Ec67 family RNA-directed DNA polymerase/endonuclease [Vibrio owensii]|uniref:retron Ec67 family RNA-directed DNA polymerase/endonuclease n=1 Tax=Vibrio owensii TaxID=696485 RepID=UPI002FEF10B2
MNAITQLKNCHSRIDLAILLKCKPSFLSYVLYKKAASSKYYEFEIDKKNGGKRKICAPADDLKSIQRNLSDLLLDCIDDINKDKNYYNTLSHGFSREKSIISNAEMHRGQKNVLNIDLDNFFGSFNFGRVRGFFIKNRNFELNEEVATTIAQIACYENQLPQGSPCSPVITNLIAHPLDIRLAKLAKQHSCIYTRYADDITFSTRLKDFPAKLMAQPTPNEYVVGSKLNREIQRAGFNINHDKTRIQYKDSRQDVTGLVVNKKIGVKREYRQLTKAMCNSLFHTGSYTKLVGDNHIDGSLDELEGRLNFIDYVDLHNRLQYPEKLSIHYPHRNYGSKTRALLTSRETTLSRFLFYKYFVGNEKATVLCEGKTDNIYLKAALRQLAAHYPTLQNESNHECYLDFLNYSKRTKFLLELFGGTAYLAGFITSYNDLYSYYKGPKANNPVIIVLDNDDGFDAIASALNKTKSCTINPTPTHTTGHNFNSTEYKNSNFIHVCHNLYVVLTPLNNGSDTMIEDLFDRSLWQTSISGRTFDPTGKLKPSSSYYGKNIFATEVVAPRQSSINFDGFKPLLDRLTDVVGNYAP